MTVDPLDAVGQGHAWYGYNLPRSDGNARQVPGDSSATPLEILRRSGGLMADQLFGGVATQQEQHEHQEEQHRQQGRRQEAAAAAAKVKKEVSSPNARNKARRRNDFFHQVHASGVEPADCPQAKPVSTATVTATASAHSLQYPPLPTAPTGMRGYPFPVVDLHNHVPLVQPDQHYAMGQGQHQHTGHAAAAAAQAGHYPALDLSFPLPMPGLIGAGAGTGAIASGSPFSSHQSAMMAPAPSVASDSHNALGNPASGLGLWGWCFPTTIMPAGATAPPGVGAKGAGGTGEIIHGVRFRDGSGVVGGDGRSRQPGGRGPPFFAPNEEMVPLGPPKPPTRVWGRSAVGDVAHDVKGGAGGEGVGGFGGGRGVGGQGVKDEPSPRTAGMRATGMGGVVGAGLRAGVKGERCSTALDASEMKRQERNAREQRRSLMTSQQIDKLRLILQENGIDTKANKCSVLSEVVGYVTQLEQGLQDLEAERQTWLRETADAPEVAREGPNGGAIDCKQVLANESVALAMATVEGRLMEGNLKFKSLSGYGDEELKRLTLLKLTAAPDLEETCEGLSAMLTDGTGKAPEQVTANAVLKEKDAGGRISVSLVRDALGRPKFFLCTLLSNTSSTSNTSNSTLAEDGTTPKATSRPRSPSSLGRSSSSGSAVSDAPASTPEESSELGLAKARPPVNLKKRGSSSADLAVKIESEGGWV